MTKWEAVRAVQLRPGDVTPAGVVRSVELNGGLHLVDLEVEGIRFVRPYAALVDRQLAQD